MPNAVSVASTNGSEFIVRIRPRGQPMHQSAAADYGPALFADLWGEFLHYTVFRRRWWVEAFLPPRALRSRGRWAETVASESVARERMKVFITAIETGNWVPGAETPPPSVRV
jgi:hypothetical protein